MHPCAPSRGACHQFSVQRSTFSARRGVTLVEMLISLACVIILMMAYTQLFSDVGGSINDARSMIELSNRMRSTENMLRNDLAGITCDMTVWQRPESGAGYFEILEGPLSDREPGLTAAPPELQNYPLGDTDDVLMFTARSQGAPFVGRNGSPADRIESEVAEVVWFLRPTMQPPASGGTSTTPTSPPTYTLYRRTFLVTPSLAPLQVSQTDFARAQYDRSMHLNSGTMIPNTLGDLTKRENRAAHAGPFYPYRVNYSDVVPFGGQVLSNLYSINSNLDSYDRYGEDAVLTNVIAFDVQVWDATAPIYLSSGVQVGPNDPGFKSAYSGTPPSVSTAPVNQGTYVDLNWFGDFWNPADPNGLRWSNNVFLSPFFRAGHPRSELEGVATRPLNYRTSWLENAATGDRPAVYDTWSFHYENNGGTPGGPGDEDNDGTLDEGTNGLDDDNQNGVDDPGEYETSPPYPYPLRGIKITLRCYEPDSRQVREVSIVESFVPE